jgi:hypothetical protein
MMLSTFDRATVRHATETAELAVIPCRLSLKQPILPVSISDSCPMLGDGVKQLEVECCSDMGTCRSTLEAAEVGSERRLVDCRLHVPTDNLPSH